MSKYVNRILDEVAYNFERHFTDKEDQLDFLEDLIEEIQGLLEELKYEEDDE